MNCAYKNYLYIYNIKLIEENTLIEKKNNFQTLFFVLLVLKNFFINSTKHVFFLRTKTFSRIQFSNIIFFFKTLKTILKNGFPEQFSKATTK